MNQILSCFVFMFSTSATLLSQTQAIPNFETTVWFEDAMGNKDSVVVGYDTTANVRFNPAFGESHIIEPFAGAIDVRAAHLLDYRYQGRILSKKIITQGESPFFFQGCYAASGVVCFVKTQNQPVTISWDVNPFNAKCLQSSFITPNQRWELVIPFELDWSRVRAQCMRYTPYELYIASEHVPNNELPYKTIHQGDTIIGVAIKFAFDAALFPLCRNSISTEIPYKLSSSHLSPNPAFEMVMLETEGEPGAQLIQVFNMEGRMLMEITPRSDNAPVSLVVADFPPGVYTVLEHLEHGQRRFGRFIKF